MKRTVYLLSVCSIVALLPTSSCQDHLSPSPAANCQITQVVEKVNATDPAAVGESITINAATFGIPTTQTYTLTTLRTRTYAYSGTGQLTQEFVANVNPAAGNAINRYEYSPSTLKISGEVAGRPIGDINYALNSQGLLGALLNGTATYRYNADGYLVEANEGIGTAGNSKTTNTIVDGNLVKKEIVDPASQLTKEYMYDLTKANVPNIRAFEGKQSRSLLTKSVQDYTANNVNGNILKTNFTATYAYTYDSQGRVKRRIEVLTYSSAAGGALPPTPGSITSVTTLDYTYACQ